MDCIAVMIVWSSWCAFVDTRASFGVPWKAHTLIAQRKSWIRVNSLFYEQEKYTCIIHVVKLIFYRSLLVEDRKPRLNVYSVGHERSVAETAIDCMYIFRTRLTSSDSSRSFHQRWVTNSLWNVVLSFRSMRRWTTARQQVIPNGQAWGHHTVAPESMLRILIDCAR